MPHFTCSKPLHYGNYTRYLILIISTLALSVIASNTLILNFTLICMSNKTAQMSNVTANQSYSSEETNYTGMQTFFLYAATAIGNLVGTYPVIVLEEKITMRKLLTIFGMISAISTLLIPLLAHFGFAFLFAMRFFEGVAYASVFPAIGAIVSQWSILANSGMYISLMLCHLQIGPLFSMPISGVLCESSFGWPATYYLHGILTIFIIFLFYNFYRDSPRIHKNVSSKELAKIEFGKEVTYAKKMPKVPYGAIIRDISIWGVWIASFGGNLGFQLFFQQGPVYLNKVLNFTVEKTGIISALPMLLSIIVKVLAGPLSDHGVCCNEKTRVMLFTFVSQAFMISCFIFLALIPPDAAILGQIAYTAAIAFSGLNGVGIIRSAQLVARQHVHFVLAIISIISCVVILITPLLVILIAPDNTPQQWSIIFYVIVALMIVCNGFFFVVGEASPASWTEVNNTNQVYTVNQHQPTMISATMIHR